MALTQKDIEKLKEVFTTKEELKRELARFTTKEDLKRELARFATKEDLQALKSDYLDKIMKKLEDMSLEQKMAYSQYKRQEEKLENHATRIKTLEDRVLV